MLLHKNRVIFLAITLALFSTSSFANTNFTGFYLGAVLGYSYVPLNFISRTVEYTSTSERDYHLNGPVGGVEFGYGAVIKNNYYLGLDFMGLLNNVSSTETFSATGSSQKLELKQKNHYGLDLHAGYVLQDNILLYGIAGYSQGSFNANERNVVGTTFDKTCEKSATLSGLDLGFGAKFSISSHVDMDIKYIYTNYNSFPQLVSASSFSKNDKYSPKSHLFALGVLYKF